MEETGIARLTPEEAKARLDRGDPFIPVDVRKESVYARGHIPGALCLPMTDLDERLGALPAGKSFIFY
ncbi:MAG: rhodanese-like domain-containing protein [candidate division NC10 bacterium]|jgi:rhodanese-related sulfurtransferase|nr:rhodanese-like domain-containing protein [candidate division NC10 bacterium]MCZ6551440.1 rhodanese-like domain-containing protein [candidate division NC10 bacterium]